WRALYDKDRGEIIGWLRTEGRKGRGLRSSRRHCGACKPPIDAVARHEWLVLGGGGADCSGERRNRVMVREVRANAPCECAPGNVIPIPGRGRAPAGAHDHDQGRRKELLGPD